MTQGQTLAEVFGFTPPRYAPAWPRERYQWYAAHSCRRDAIRYQTTREVLYDRRCPLCGKGLGGWERLVFFSCPLRRVPSSERHLFLDVPRAVQIVTCTACQHLYSPGEYARVYRDRTRNSNPLPLPE